MTRESMTRTMEIPPLTWQQIAAALPAAQADIVAQLATTAAQHGATLYLVGGAARSIFHHQPITDLDVAISHISPALVQALAQTVGARVAPHEQFSTATLIFPADAALPHIDIVPTRRETYAHPGALPQVTAADIHTDLARRDISVNAIAVAVVPNGHCTVYDPHDGIGDLRHRRARLLHPLSCVDDPTRIIRMARIACRLKLRITQSSLVAVQRALTTDALPHVSQHRWLQELRKTMHEPDPGEVLARLQQWRVLSAIHPALRYRRALRTVLPQAPHEARLALLIWRASRRAMHDLVESWHELPGSYRQLPALKQVVATFRRHPHLQPSHIAAMLRPFAPALCAGIALADATLATMMTLWHHAQQTTPAVLASGADLLAVGLTPGPHIGQALAALRDALLDGVTTAASRDAQVDWMLNHAHISHLHRQLL